MWREGARPEEHEVGLCSFRSCCTSSGAIESTRQRAHRLSVPGERSCTTPSERGQLAAVVVGLEAGDDRLHARGRHRRRREQPVQPRSPSLRSSPCSASDGPPPPSPPGPPAPGGGGPPPPIRASISIISSSAARRASAIAAAAAVLGGPRRRRCRCPRLHCARPPAPLALPDDEAGALALQGRRGRGERAVGGRGVWAEGGRAGGARAHRFDADAGGSGSAGRLLLAAGDPRRRAGGKEAAAAGNGRRRSGPAARGGRPAPRGLSP